MFYFYFHYFPDESYEDNPALPEKNKLDRKYFVVYNICFSTESFLHSCPFVSIRG